MNDQTYHPLCYLCLEDGIESMATVQRWGEDVCADCADARNEQAHEASLDDFYGGSGPVTVNEFCARALADKQGGR